MDRRRFLLTSVACAAGPVAGGALGMLAAPVPANGQQPAKLRKIAFLCSDSCTTLPSTAFPGDQAFVRGLERAGYVIGRDVQVDSSSVGIGIARLRERARLLVGRDISLMLVLSALAAWAARRATTTIPIVMVGAADPVEEGLAESLGRPGGNVTGLAVPSGQLAAKQIELLLQIRPTVSRIAVLWDPNARQTEALTRIEAALQPLGVRVHRIELSNQLDIEKALKAVTEARADALLGLDHLANHTARRDIALFALRTRLPTVTSTTGVALSGALITYGPALDDLFDGAAGYVGKILGGAKPSQLPIEEPKRFNLILNLATAKALGLTIPPSLLARADQVIE